VLIRLREGRSDYQQLVDIHDLPELGGLSEDPNGTIRIGSGVTFARLIQSPLLAEKAPVLVQGASVVGGPQIRNMATLGGNLANGAPSADSAAPLLVLNAVVRRVGPDGVRESPLMGFHLAPGRVDLKPGEIVTEIRIPKEGYDGWQGRYIKYAMRSAMDIPTIGCAAAARVERGVLAGVRLAFVVAAPVPSRCPRTEAALTGLAVDNLAPDGPIRSALRAVVLTDLAPRDSWRASKAFREHLIPTLAERVLADLLAGQGAANS
jgi:xanthine dehydrogenase FAD-binding subunit